MIGELSYNEAVGNYIYNKYIPQENKEIFIISKNNYIKHIKSGPVLYIFWLENYIAVGPKIMLELFNYFKNNSFKKEILNDFINLCKISFDTIYKIINNTDISLEIKIDLINNYIYFNGYIPNNIINKDIKNIIEKAIAGRKIVKYIKNAMNDQFILTKLKYNIELKRIKKILD